MNMSSIALRFDKGINSTLVPIFRRDEKGRVPVFTEHSPFQQDPHWKDLRLFHEYFHGDTGLGLGASHQTGWSGLVANLIKRKYELKAEGSSYHGDIESPGL